MIRGKERESGGRGGGRGGRGYFEGYTNVVFPSLLSLGGALYSRVAKTAP